MEFMFVIIILIIIILLASIKQVNEYEKGVLFSFGKFTRILDAGWHVVLPIFQSFPTSCYIHQFL